MKKKLSKLVTLLLICCLTISNLSITSFAAVKTSERKSTNRGTALTALYQDGSLSAAYSENEGLEKYSAPQQGTYEGDLYQGLKNFENEINVSKYIVSLEEALDAYRCLINGNPDLFFVSNALSYYAEIYCSECGGYVAEAENGGWIILDETFEKGKSCNHNPSSHKTKMALTHWRPNYIEDSKAQLSAMVKKFDSAVAAALSGIDNSMTQLEKALYLHDYIVKLNAYDYENFVGDTVPNVSHSAYGPLVMHVSVCDGYSLAYSCLLQKCGINARLITSNAMEHAWNAVEIDGSWYFVDLTNDDPTCAFYDNVDGKYQLSSLGDKYCLVSHGAFLSSEELWSQTEYGDGCYTGWAQTDVKCTNKKYDTARWKENENEYAYCDGYWYYIEKKQDKTNTYVEAISIMRTEDPVLAGTAYFGFDEQSAAWPVDFDNHVYNDMYCNVSVHAPTKQLFFNTDNAVWAIDLSVGIPENLNTPFKTLRDFGFDPTKTLTSFYGLIVVDNTLYIGTANNPYEKQKVASFSLLTPGDANGSGKVDIEDALTILKYIAQIPTPNINTAAADVSKNNKVDMEDALLVLKYIAKIVTNF